MKKILFISILSMLLVGCSTTYNLEIAPAGIKEDIYVTYAKNELDFIPKTDDDVPDQAALNDIASSEVYNKKLIVNDDNYVFNYNYSHDFTSIKESIALSACYDLFSMTSHDGVTTILTSEQFKCAELEGYNIEDIYVKIKTDYEVTNHNADKVEENIYTWVINKEHISKPIKFSFKNTMEIKPVSKVGFYMKLIIAILIPVVIGFIVFIIVAAKNKSANKI